VKHPNARWPHILGTAALAGVTCAGFSIGIALFAGLAPWIAGSATGLAAALFVGHAIYKWGPGESELLGSGESAAFELQPHLKGQLLELRPLRSDDFDALYDAARDPLIWEQHPEPDRYKPDVFRKYFDGAIESRGAFAIIDRKTGRIIGSSRYCDLRPAESQVEIGWTFLERKYWGGDYNGESKRLMIEHAFKFVERIVFVVGANNRRSRKALEKIGAKLVPDAAVSPDKVVFALERG
jgi:RimJ/RimL family protein N-acetyltransferase